MRFYLSSKELRLVIGTPESMKNLRTSPGQFRVIGQLLITVPAKRFTSRAILSSMR